MTRDLQQRLEEQWPELSKRLRAYLLRRGVRNVDDIVQETAARLVSMWEKVDPKRPTWPLVKTIALNLLRDQARRRYDEVPSELPDLPLHHDNDSYLMAHLEIGRVRTALGAMSPAHRAILLAETGINTGHQGTGSDAEKMMRMRARRRLKELVKKLPAMLPARLRFFEAGQMLSGLRDLALPSVACLACASLYPSFVVPSGDDVAQGRAGASVAASTAVWDGPSSTVAIGDELVVVRAAAPERPTNRGSRPRTEAPPAATSEGSTELPQPPALPGYQGMPVAQEEVQDVSDTPDTAPELPSLPMPEVQLPVEIGL